MNDQLKKFHKFIKGFVTLTLEVVILWLTRFPGANVVKLYFLRHQNRLECLSLASLFQLPGDHLRDAPLG
jgi:hypothetical protein